VIERFVKDKFDIRAQKPVMKNVVHVVRDFDDPIPPDASNLDLITFFFAYHDITYMPVDRAVMNQKMFAALKPGGFLVIADHSAKPGEGITVAKTLHRIEEKTVRIATICHRTAALDGIPMQDRPEALARAALEACPEPDRQQLCGGFAPTSPIAPGCLHCARRKSVESGGNWRMPRTYRDRNYPDAAWLRRSRVHGNCGGTRRRDAHVWICDGSSA